MTVWNVQIDWDRNHDFTDLYDKVIVRVATAIRFLEHIQEVCSALKVTPTDDYSRTTNYEAYGDKNIWQSGR